MTDVAVRSPRAGSRALFFIVLGSAFLGFVLLGVWQIERLSWKVALIERVDRRVHASPTPAPGPDRWPEITAADDEYRHLRLSGTFLHDKETLVQAATRLGGGFWVLTPLQTVEGPIVLVNRGFVLPEQRARESRQRDEPSGPVEVTGLLRITEPHGGFLRNNDRTADRWYSRDVAAITTARGLRDVAPYFVDQDAASSAPDTQPVAGLTVVEFHNSHLVYAITWFALAVLSIVGVFLVWRSPRR